MSRQRALLLGGLGAVVPVLLVAAFLSAYERVEHRIPLPPRGEAGYNPLYALKLALGAEGQRVESRQYLQLDAFPPGRHDTLLVYSDPRTLTSAQLEALFAFAHGGGHLILRLPAFEWQEDADDADTDAGGLGRRLGVQVATGERGCVSLLTPGEEDHEEFCGDARFDIDLDVRPLAAWRDEAGQHVFARFPHGVGSVDLVSDLGFLGNDQLRDGPHLLLARQLLEPRWGQGTFHLVYAADMPPLWRWLLERAWMAVIPLLLAFLAWLWMRMPRFGPPRPSPMPPRRSLLEHVQASGEHLKRYGQWNLLHRALRDNVLVRLRRRDPLAAALEGEAQAAQLAPRTGLPAAEVRAALDTRPPQDARDFLSRTARLLDLRKRL